MECGSSHPAAPGKNNLPNNISQKNLKVIREKKFNHVTIAHLNTF